MGMPRFEVGDFLAYLSPGTRTLRWARVVEVVQQFTFVRCETFSHEQPEGTLDVLQLTQGTLFRVGVWAFAFARKLGWPPSIDAFYLAAKRG